MTVRELPTLSEDAGSRRLYLVLALVLIVGAFVIFMQWWMPMHGGVDENGYLVAGKALARTGSLAVKPQYGPDGVVPTFMGDMWLGVDLGTASERYYTKYPPGFPALIALAMLVGGESHGPVLAYLLNPVCYCLGLLATYLLVRRFAGSLPALGALVCVIGSGPVVRLFTIPGSHGISFGALAWAMYLLVRWLQGGGMWPAIAAGLLCGFGAIVRTGEIVLLAPLVVAAGARVWTGRSRADVLQSVAMLAAWALPVAIAIALQVQQIGSWSAYATTGEGSSFSLAYFVQHFGTMIVSLTMRGVFLAAPLGLIGLVLLWRYDWRLSAVLLTWVLANIALYTSYYWAPYNEYNLYARFFLPSYPALVAGAAGLLVWPAARSGYAPMAATAALLAGLISAAVSASGGWTWSRVEMITRDSLRQRLEWMDERITPDGVLFCDELDMLNHLQFASDRRLYDFRMFRYSRLHELATDEGLNSLAAGRKSYLRERFLPLGQAGLTDLRNGTIAAYIESGQRVFVFSGPLRQWESWEGLAAHGLTLRYLGEVNLPMPPVPIIPIHWDLQEVVPVERP